MASWQYRFYSTLPRRVFDHVASSWPSAMVRRHAWKVGGSGIWYVTIALDEAEAAEQFDAWLDGNSRRMNISKLVGGGGNYEAV